MEQVLTLMGKSVRGKVCRYGWPEMTGKVVSVSNALYGNIRVQFEDGSQALMIWPHLETMS